MRVSAFSRLSGLFVLSDEQAMSRVQKQGDRQAFTLLMHRWEARTRRFCTHLTGDRHLAEDLVEEVFMRIFAHRNDFRHDAHFSTYLMRIALNACYDERRCLRRRTQGSLSQDVEDEPSLQGNLAALTPDPGTVVAKQERIELVRKALFKLPEHYRQVVILRHYECLRFREIAEVLDIPQGTVQSRMTKALKHLARLLAPILKEDRPDETS